MTFFRWKALDEIDAGACDGMTYADIHRKFYEEFLKRDEDKYSCRYPGGNPTKIWWRGWSRSSWSWSGKTRLS